MAYLGRGLEKISNIEVLDNITFDGSSSYSITKGSVAFTPNSAQSLLISIDGIVQATNFSVNSSTIDFGVAIPSTSVCNFFLHYGTGVMTVPSDGSVTTAKLGDDAVTGAKLSKPFNYDSGTFYIDDTNNRIGIKTSSPLSDLHLGLSNAQPTTSGNMANNGITLSNGSGGRAIQIGVDDTNSRSYIQASYVNNTSTATDLAVLVGANERLNIETNGTVGLGKTNGLYGIWTDNGTGGGNTYRQTTSGGIHHFKSDVGGTNTLKAYIGDSGAYNNLSDYRLKENINDLPSCIEKIKLLRPVNFNFKNHNKLKSGFIAHELKEQFNHIVDGEKDQVKEDGSIFVQMIDQSSLIPHLTKALQEAITKIEELEARITILENK